MVQQFMRVFLSVGLGILSSWVSAEQCADVSLSLHAVLTSVLRVASNLLALP